MPVSISLVVATLSSATFLDGKGCQDQFFFISSDTLIGKNFGRYNRGEPWVVSVKAFTPDIVILSAGPHIYNRSNFELMLNTVIEDAKELRRLNPNIQLVWKTQQPGGCTHDITSEVTLGQDHHHAEYYERDIWALSVLPEHGFHILDLRLLYFRSDAHPSSKGGPVDPRKGPDCLHFCLPGPLEVIAPLFSKLLDARPFRDSANYRKGCPEGERDYLGKYYDVSAMMNKEQQQEQSGKIYYKSGFDHYQKVGLREGRSYRYCAV